MHHKNKCLSSIITFFFIKVNKNYNPQMENLNKMENLINDDLDLSFSDNESDNESNN